MSGGSSSSKAKDLTPEEFTGIRAPIAGELTSGFGQGAGLQAFDPAAASGGGFVAGLTGGQQAGLNQLQALSDPAGSQGAFSTLQGIAGGNQLDLANDPVFNQNLDFLGRRFAASFDPKEEANKALFARAGQQAPSSSAFANAQSRISEAKTQGLADLAAQFGGQQLQANRDRQIQASSALNTLEQGRAERAQANLTAQELPRLIEDLGLERAREEFIRRQQAIQQNLALAGGLASPSIGQFSKSAQGGLL